MQIQDMMWLMMTDSVVPEMQPLNLWGPLGDLHYFIFSCSRIYIGHYILLEHMYIYLSVTYISGLLSCIYTSLYCSLLCLFNTIKLHLMETMALHGNSVRLLVILFVE